MFHTFFSPKWEDELRDEISPVKIYFPIECLRNLGIDQVKELIKTFAEKLQPLHGMAGLALQQTLQWESYQYLEYPLAWRYRGLDVSNVDFDSRFNHGLKAVNWLNILSDTLLNEKFGGLEGLKSRNRDHSVKILPYRGGVIVQAGEVPSLGEEAHDPYPVHYVNANLLLKPARAPEIGYLGIGSNRGEIRFNPITTKQWQERFDLPDEASLEKDEQDKARISVITGEKVEQTGIYGAMVKGVTAYQHLSEDHSAPDSRVAIESEPETLTWYLLKSKSH